MIEINLLPDEKRKKTKEFFSFDLGRLGIDKGKIAPIAGAGAVGFLVLLVLLFFMGSSIRTHQMRKLMLKEQAMSEETSGAELVNDRISILRTKMQVLSQITKRQFLWAQKLNELSDLVLPGIWLTRMRTDVDNNFVIEGSVVSKKGEAMASVGEFMKNISEHQSFFKDFSNIRLESVQRRSQESKDVVDFKIVLYFKDYGY